MQLLDALAKQVELVAVLAAVAKHGGVELRVNAAGAENGTVGARAGQTNVVYLELIGVEELSSGAGSFVDAVAVGIEQVAL